ncbi:MAG: hypothetical protein HPY51_08460 [Candidatus Omnitrophica bacterium]|nr:hypothetical protein [Candidatus Omnitrophota bacterium]
MNNNLKSIWIMGCMCLGCLGMLLGAMTAESATWTVNPDGSGNFTTIQAAIDAASPGDIIEIATGIYNEDLSIGDINSAYNKKNGLTLKAASGANVEIRATNQKSRVGTLTALGADFGPADRTGFFVYGDNTTLEGLKIVQPDATVNNLNINLAMIVVSSNVTIRNCEFVGAGATSAGDVVGAAVSPLDVMGFMGGQSVLAVNVLFENCKFHDFPYAFATADLPLELGVPIPPPEATLINCEFYNNGTAVEMDDGTTTIVDCYIHDCGEGISISDDASTIRNCRIVNNLEHGISIDTSENEDDEPAGNPVILIENCYLADNGEQDGHNGIRFEQGTITIKNTVVTNSSGSNLFITPDDNRVSTAVIDHCDFYNSFIGTAVGTSAAPEGSSSITITNSIIVDADGIVNDGGDLLTFNVSYCDIFVTGAPFLGDAITSANILNVDPGYVDPANGDFHLQENSPLLTAGIGGTFLGAKGSITQVEYWMLQQ